MQATLAISTDSDRDAVQLLENEYNVLSGWANDVVCGAPGSQWRAKTGDPNALQNDPATRKNYQLRQIPQWHDCQRNLCGRRKLPLASRIRSASRFSLASNGRGSECLALYFFARRFFSRARSS